jgi:transposase InsO family protein
VYYGADVDAALFKIWDTMDHPCAENMHPAIREYITYFTAERDWPFDDVTTGKICAVSVGTLKRKIKRLRKKHDLPRGRSATVSSPLKGMIPIRKSHTWQHLPPGYVQTDTVVHCGDLLTGDVVYSLGCVDFATYWSEYTAQWNKGKEATCESLELVRTRFPFPIQELHPDSGDEFINYHVHAWSKKRGIEMTRSEPYKKNDNMCIEERNNSLARKHLGYARLDAIEFVPLAQEIPRVACLLHNHFRPVRRMISKVRIGAKWKRTFEKKAQTPYQRMLEHAAVSEENKDALRIVHETLNPLELKRQLDILKTQLGRKVVERLVAKKKASQ